MQGGTGERRDSRGLNRTDSVCQRFPQKKYRPASLVPVVVVVGEFRGQSISVAIESQELRYFRAEASRPRFCIAERARMPKIQSDGTEAVIGGKSNFRGRGSIRKCPANAREAADQEIE